MQSLKKLQHESKYLEYNDNILIIKLDSKGNFFNIQWNGVSCNQYKNKGKLLFKFKSSLKYFNSQFWYKATNWFLNENLIYFVENSDTIISNSIFPNNEKFEQYKNSIKNKCVKIEDILNEILKECRLQTKFQIEFNDKLENFSKTWGEALIPIIVNGKNCLLTWNNCD